ncbi:MAG: hypothetical protein J7K51_03065 [Thermotogae bacterium]|nr:hypothetical protein [Thermotogota bacterium]
MNPSVSRVVKSVFKRYYKEAWDLIIPSFVWFGFFSTFVLAGPATVAFYSFVSSDPRKRRLSEFWKKLRDNFSFGFKLGMVHVVFIFLMIIFHIFLKKGIGSTFINSIVFFTILYLWLMFDFFSIYIVPIELKNRNGFWHSFLISSKISIRSPKYTLGLLIQILLSTFLTILSVVGFPILFPGLLNLFIDEGFLELIDIKHPEEAS